MIECIEGGCVHEATHILVDYRHNIIGGGETYCQKHAFIDGREQCPCCDDFPIEFDDEDTEERVELLPTYPQGELDSEGCCCEHP